MSEFLKQLTGGDRRSIGKANDLAEAVIASPKLFREVMAELIHEDPVVRMRCADLAEKVSRSCAEWLQPYKWKLLAVAEGAIDKEIRWHLAQMLPRLVWTQKERSGP
jgi:hypothetical protein